MIVQCLIPCRRSLPFLVTAISYQRSSLRLQRCSMASLKRKAGPLSGSPNDQKKPKKDATLTSFFGAPKVSSSAANATSTVAPASAPITFDSEKWAASLTPEQKSLLKLEIDTLHPSWLAHLKDELTTSSFLDLKRFIQKELDSGKKIFPPLEEVYSWCVFPYQMLSVLTSRQVTSYTTLIGQGSGCWSRSVPQSQSSPWHMFLCPPTNRRSPVAEQHICSM